MIEEPYRWMEAIANRREYVEHQIAGGSPVAAVSYADGILLFTVGRERQKIFEIYDRIAMAAIGHPGDIERLRMAAIELAGSEGFARSADDVSLRRLATYSLSPALKAAFEQVYGAPFLTRLLLAELGRGGAPNLFARLDFDGSLHTNGGAFGRTFEDFGVLAPTANATSQMEKHLKEHQEPAASLKTALLLAAGAWAVGRLTAADNDRPDAPSSEQIAECKREEFGSAVLEAAVLDRKTGRRIAYRPLPEKEVRELLDVR